MLLLQVYRESPSERASLQPEPFPVSTEAIARYVEREFLLLVAEVLLPEK